MASNGSALTPGRDTSTPRSGTPRPQSNSLSNERRPTFLDALPLVLSSHLEVARALLFCGNADVHAIAAAEVYRQLVVEVPVAGTVGHDAVSDDNDDRRPCCPGHGMKPKLLAVLRELQFLHPCAAHASTAINELTRSSDRLEAWELASSLLDHLPHIEKFSWETGFGVGGDMWIAIATLRKLRSLHLAIPALHPSQQVGSVTFPRLTPALQKPEEANTDTPRAVGLNGRALGAAWENLEELHIDGLSASGARTIASHLLILALQSDGVQLPQLHTLYIGTHFADLRLCQSIAQFGALRSLRHVTLATSGTKLKDECLQILFGGCSALESLTLDDIEGRLTETAWSEVPTWPHSFSNLVINISETGSHHSWVLKHLASIHEVPFRQLKRFAVRRLIHPIARLPFPPSNVVVPTPAPSHVIEDIPQELVFLISRHGSRLEHLCLDWWEMSNENLEDVLSGCPQLRALEISVKAAVIDIIGMTTAFANVPELMELNIASDPKYARTAVKTKPTASKNAQICSIQYLTDRMAEPDASLLEIRELRKFARRMPYFRILRWAGRQGKGEWHFEQCKKTLTPVTFIHSAVLTSKIWTECQKQPPSFEFDDDEFKDEILEPPVSPERTVIELPLTRTTTNTSSVSSTRRSSTTVMEAESPPKSQAVPHGHWTPARTRLPPPVSTRNPVIEPREREPRKPRVSMPARVEPPPKVEREREGRSRGGRGRREKGRQSLPAAGASGSGAGSGAGKEVRGGREARGAAKEAGPVVKEGKGAVKEARSAAVKEVRHVPGSARKSVSPVKKAEKVEKKADDGWTTVDRKKK